MNALLCIKGCFLENNCMYLKCIEHSVKNPRGLSKGLFSAVQFLIKGGLRFMYALDTEHFPSQLF